MAEQAKRKVVLMMSMAMGLLLFQNCAGDGFGSQDVGSHAPTGVNNSSSQNSNQGSAGASGQNAVITNVADGMIVEDSSLGNGSIVTRLTEKIYNAKAGLKGCTGIIANYNTVCLNDSDFIFITSAAAWGATSYDAARDIYSVDRDITSYNWPMTTYFTRYIAADGSRKEFIFTPKTLVLAAPARLQWVFTNPQACVGPTPAPAPIGQSCTVDGETKTNACGTATCQFK